MAYEDLATIGACTKGDLPDRQYDIHCPLMGGPAYKYNYVTAGCLERQLAGCCSAKACPRKKIRLAAKRAAAVKPGSTFTLGTIVHGKRVAICAECGLTRPAHGRGCCGSCYWRLRGEGTLDAKHPAKQGGRKKTLIVRQESTEGSPNSRHADPVFVEENPDKKTRSPRRCEPVIEACRKGKQGNAALPGVTAGETAQFEEETVAKNKKVANCAECGRLKPITARDLCGKCYAALKTAGTLDAKYPAKHLVKGERMKSKPLPEIVPGDNTAHVGEAVDEPRTEVPVLMAVEEVFGQELLEAIIRDIPPAEFEPGSLRVVISFEDNDITLGEYLQKWAKQDRRALSDQILFVLDQAVTDRINGSPA
jgi:hypothetical protein